MPMWRQGERFVRVTNMIPVIAPIRNGIRTGGAMVRVAISCGMGVCSSKGTSQNLNRAHAKSKNFTPRKHCSVTCNTILNAMAFVKELSPMANVLQFG